MFILLGSNFKSVFDGSINSKAHFCFFLGQWVNRQVNTTETKQKMSLAVDAAIENEFEI